MSDPALSGVPSARSQRAGEPVRQAIAEAARTTGVDFGFLLAQAKVESGLDPEAKAKTSSATGLFQFIDSTWLRMAERHGSAMGLGSRFDLSNPASRQAVLDLRNDPHIASQMAAMLAQENSAILSPALGRAPDTAELYLAHFLGAGEAVRFLTALGSDPSAPAAPLFAKQAAANRAIFLEAGGSERSLAGVMDLMRGKIEAGMPEDIPAAQWAQQARGGTLQPTAPRYEPAGFAQPLTAPAHLEARRAPPLSAVLESQFSLGAQPANSGSIGDHARRAYDRLKAFGL